MATLAGTQSTLHEALSSLLELEFDALAAYSAAIERLEEPGLREQFERFQADHRRHANELTDALVQMGLHAPGSVDAKVILTQGKVLVGNWIGDKGILLAMRSNENDTNAAYERIVKRDDLPPTLRTSLERGLGDERRHRAWISEQLARFGEGPPPEPASEEYLGAKWG